MTTAVRVPDGGGVDPAASETRPAMVLAEVRSRLYFAQIKTISRREQVEIQTGAWPRSPPPSARFPLRWQWRCGLRWSYLQDEVSTICGRSTVPRYPLPVGRPGLKSSSLQDQERTNPAACVRRYPTRARGMSSSRTRLPFKTTKRRTAANR